jgi:hypothetical protein
VAAQIDHHIQTRLSVDGIPVSPPCDDAEFIRRVYLDITGVIPTPDKLVAFLDNRDPDNRARLLDELLSSSEYGLHFGDQWCERIGSRDLPMEKQPFILWMADSLNQGRSWNDVVFNLLTAVFLAARSRRMSSEDPEAFFVLVNTESAGNKTGPRPEWLAAESARLFLGVQIQCAECHDHPFTSEFKQRE